MGKEKPGFLTPKAIANRLKSKGLQKLRWYCQMCQKQCRDEVIFLNLRCGSTLKYKNMFIILLEEWI
jgi:DNA/RNA-binding protein KIN17